MKYLLLILLLFSQELISDSKIDFQNSEKLNIVTLSEDPSEFEISDLYRHSIKIIYDVDNVKKIIINDLNIKDGMCQTWVVSDKEIAYLSFTKPSLNQKSIIIRINRPCALKRKVKLELFVRTGDKKVYSNIITFKAMYSNQIRYAE